MLWALLCPVWALPAARGILRVTVAEVDVTGVLNRTQSSLVLRSHLVHTAELLFPTQVRTVGIWKLTECRSWCTRAT